MKRTILTGVLALSIAGLPGLFMGCERELAHEKKVEQTPNGTTVKEKKVTENPDGSITKTETKDSSHNP